MPGVAAAWWREGEPGADEAVQRPEQGDEAEDPGADGAQGQGVVQAVDEGHQVGEALAQVAPQAPAEDLAGVGVHEHFVDIKRVRFILWLCDNYPDLLTVLFAACRRVTGI